VIDVTLGDLLEEDQHRIMDEMTRELEEVEATRMHEKLMCY
jgi:hypothetical protein